MPSDPDPDFSQVPGAASVRPVYREGTANPCPGCGRDQWLIGRFSSECAFCGTALPLQEGGTREAYVHDAQPAFVTRGGDEPST